MTRRRSALVLAMAAVLVLGAAGTHLLAQRGGGRGGGGGFGGGMMQPPTRLRTLVASFKLDKTQEKAAKALMDAAYKAAAPTREALVKAHAAIGAAIADGDDRGGLDRAIADYAQLAADMNDREMTALAGVLALIPDAQPSGPAVDMAVAMMRGAFVGKKWDAAPGEKGY